MIRFFSAVAISAMMVSALLGQSTQAQMIGDEGQLKPGDTSTYSTITMNCLDVKIKLSKIYEQDGLHRVNAGQIYDTVSNRLMAKLNAKIVNDRLDGSDLIKSAAAFEEALVDFREEYHTYGAAMSRLLKSDCKSHQQTFYLHLTEVRNGRKAVHESVTAITTAAKEYLEAFRKFRDTQLNRDTDDITEEQ